MSGTKKHFAGQRVYVQFRTYDVERKTMRHCRGLTVIFDRATPEQVHKLIVDAAKAASDKARREKHGDAKEEGTGTAAGGGTDSGNSGETGADRAGD